MTHKYINREHPTVVNVGCAQRILNDALQQIYRTPVSRCRDWRERDRYNQGAVMLSDAIGHLANHIRSNPECWIEG